MNRRVIIGRRSAPIQAASKANASRDDVELDDVDSLFNEARLQIIILQVSIIGIIALGVTQVIITGGIDLSSGSVVVAAAMIAMSFAQVGEINGLENTRAVFFEQGWSACP